MARKRNFMGKLALVLLFGFSGTVYAQSQGGTFTLTDVPSRFNGNYAFIVAENENVYLEGAQSINWTDGTVTLPCIENGRVSVPMWILVDDGQTEELIRYNGNHTVDVYIVIFNSAKPNDDSKEIAEIGFYSVRFSNGNATMSFHDNNNFDTF